MQGVWCGVVGGVCVGGVWGVGGVTGVSLPHVPCLRREVALVGPALPDAFFAFHSSHFRVGPRRTLLCVYPHCVYPLCVPIVCTHCVYPLCVPIVCTHCVCPLCVPVVCTHCVYPLCVPIVHTHCTYPLYIPIACTHCVYPLCVPIVCTHCVYPLCVILPSRAMDPVVPMPADLSRLPGCAGPYRLAGHGYSRGHQRRDCVPDAAASGACWGEQGRAACRRV
jgi:hypothetical protein